MTTVAAQFQSRGREWLAYGALLAAGAAFYVVCALYPADLPFWMPWEFSWPVFLVTALSLAWFWRGLKILPSGERPALWRIACFVLGVTLDYAVLQTHVDFYAQHMFFVHRWAHFVLHHLGAFLIALGFAGPTIRAGMPGFVRADVRHQARQALGRFHAASRRRARAVRGTALFLADPADPHPRDARCQSLRRDELDDGDQRHLLLVAGPRSQAEAAGAAVQPDARAA